MHFQEIEPLLRKAFLEDFATSDITTLACTEEHQKAVAHIVLKERACVAGLAFLPDLFRLHDQNLYTKLLAIDGKVYEPKTILAIVEGPARSLLSSERVALNFLQHLSGIATLTFDCVQACKNTKCQILDTRKTLPGLRLLQKYAVRIGGGVNHRLHLMDRILIKNNHIQLPSLKECIQRSKIHHPEGWIQAEVTHAAMLKEAIAEGVHAALLDNMSVEQLAECVQLTNGRIYLEASGGITLKNVKDYADSGVDGISIGALTHSAPAIDISMRIQ